MEQHDQNENPMSDDYNNIQSSSGAKSGRREDKSSMDVDDLVSMITNKLDNLETSDSLDSLISVCVEVLNCSTEEAAFFLDSANNDLSVAVSLYLEEQTFQQRRRFSSTISEVERQSYHPFSTILDAPSAFASSPMFQRYYAKPVLIPDLPLEWVASVCPTTGVILFEHLPSGAMQSQVPPGFADAHLATSSSQEQQQEEEKEEDTRQKDGGGGNGVDMGVFRQQPDAQFVVDDADDYMEETNEE